MLQFCRTNHATAIWFRCYGDQRNGGPCVWAVFVSVLIFRHDTTEAVTVESRAAPMTKHEREEETKRDFEFRLRCQPTEYKDSLGVTHLKYTHPDCGGRVLN
jgi:hypothetical protein